MFSFLFLFLYLISFSIPMKNAKKAFEDARNDDLSSGSLKFTATYVSVFQLYQAAKNWVEKDNRVLSASIRVGGKNQHALDFRYDLQGLPEKLRGGQTLEKVFKPFFQEEFGDDYLTGWDHSNPTFIIK